MPEPWSVDQIHTLAPDAASLNAAYNLVMRAQWRELGAAELPSTVLWCSWKVDTRGATPRQTCVDVAEPAYQCSCPSRKFPCKHILALLLMWSSKAVTQGGTPPDWVTEWHASRQIRAAAEAARIARRAGEKPEPAKAKAAQRRATQRANRVAAGITELEQWLENQIQHGIAGMDRGGDAPWDTMAARLVDNQAPALAEAVRRLADIGGADREGRLLSELGLLQLLTRAYRRIDTLPETLAATVRTRVGFPVATEEVLATPSVRDLWQVIGVRETIENNLRTRRVWLVGRTSGRYALVLSFGSTVRVAATDLVVGTQIDADLCFYPGLVPLRALVAARHGAPTVVPEPSPVVGIRTLLEGYARALAADPWLTEWPALIAGTVVPGQRWHLVDPAGDALALHPEAGEPWRLLAASGGHPVTIAVEYGPEGVRPLTYFADGEVFLP